MNIGCHMPHTPSITNKARSIDAILKSVLSIVAFAVCTAIASGADLGIGYVFYKEQGFHPDSRAVVKEVVSYESFPTIVRAKTKSGQLLQITAGQAPVFVPDPNGSASPDNVKGLINQLIPKYPQHRGLLDKLLAVCNSKKVTPPTTVSAVSAPAQKQTDFFMVLVDGKKIEKIEIGELKPMSVSVISDDGSTIQNIAYESIQLGQSKLPPEAKAAIEKGKAAAEARKKSEADRAVAETKNQDKLVAEAEPAKLTDQTTSSYGSKTSNKEPNSMPKNDPEIEMEQDTMFKDMIGRLARKPGFNIQNVSGGGVVKMLTAILEDNPELALKKDEQTGVTLLFHAVFNGYKPVVELLLAHKADTNFTLGDEHYTALHIAAKQGHAELVKLFLAQGADVNSTDTGGWTPLVFAAENGNEKVQSF